MDFLPENIPNSGAARQGNIARPPFYYFATFASPAAYECPKEHFLASTHGVSATTVIEVAGFESECHSLPEFKINSEGQQIKYGPAVSYKFENPGNYMKACLYGKEACQDIDLMRETIEAAKCTRTGESKKDMNVSVEEMEIYSFKIVPQSVNCVVEDEEGIAKDMDNFLDGSDDSIKKIVGL